MSVSKQTFNIIDVLYDDKKWGKRIDPNEWNSNFKVVEKGHNDLVDKLTQQTTDICNAIDNITVDGGSNINVIYSGAKSTLQDSLDNIVNNINNRYTKSETDANIATNVNSLVKSITYNSSTGVFTITKKDDTVITIDTVIEKVPASMALQEESDGSVYLVITNQDGSSTKTNVTSLIEDTIILSSDTINATSTTDGINKTTTYTLNIKPNSVTLSHLDTELTSKFEETQTAMTLALQAKDNAVAAKVAAENSENNAETYASNANSSANDSAISANEAAASALEAKGYAEQASSYKSSAELAKVAAEKARDEAQSIAGGDYTTKVEFNSHVNDTTLHTTADEKTKLSGIEANANNYTHPSSHPATMITEDSTHRFVTDAEKNVWGEKDVFIATYGVTSFTEIANARDNGKVVYVKQDSYYFPMTYSYGTSVHRFTGFIDSKNGKNIFCSNSGWGSQDIYALPTVTTDDTGKSLMVNSSGAWAKTVPSEARTNLGFTYGTEEPTATPTTGEGSVYFMEDDGTPLPVSEGGTGAATVEGILANLGIADYIVEQGTTNNWSWEKHANGKIHCALRVQTVYSASETSGNLYYNDYDLAVPNAVPVLTNTINNVIIMPQAGNGLSFFMVKGISERTISYRYVNSASVTNNKLTVLYQFDGRWK